ncbi:MAG: GIY-YIG nuclease family protein [Verrucomicrobiota bacterium]|jgi:hypothetical protein
MKSSELRPFSIKIFLPDGRPDGLRIVEKSNWTGCGIVCPRSLFNDAKSRPEFERTGVYILVGTTDKSDLPVIYIGQGDRLIDRFRQHYSQKEFWTSMIFFTAKDEGLNRAHVQHMESRLISLAREAKKCELDNSASPIPPNLSEAEKADVESFLLDILSILPLVGLSVFEKSQSNLRKKDLLSMKGKGIQAFGGEVPEGFFVQKGSFATLYEVPSIHKGIADLRSRLLDQGILEMADGKYVFTQDYTFNSPSYAAGVVLGRGANGRTEWKNSKGLTLKEIQEAISNTDKPLGAES